MGELLDDMCSPKAKQSEVTSPPKVQATPEKEAATDVDEEPAGPASGTEEEAKPKSTGKMTAAAIQKTDGDLLEFASLFNSNDEAPSTVSDDALMALLLEGGGKELGKEAAPTTKKRRRLTMAARREMNAPPPMMKPSYYVKSATADKPLNTPNTVMLVVNAAKQSLMRSYSHDESVDADVLDDLPHKDLFSSNIIETPRDMKNMPPPPPSTGKSKAAPSAVEPMQPPAKRRRGQPVHFTWDSVAA